ncbi:uncharacterized protein BXIN_1091 [Babesia sp. Xinjiang]|uniref:uncharacterized protein n=1 Tax=Babesia sp. Xinjiang TaxID=462227 RepID=UPI000A23E157|nr:uncharacterized protein BXIN_1091 [Babesia sp. Xinjiang]ORM42267.1 hypothetical protein BXIN_1091 [Babesia sp. Xinjiang]
MMQNNEEQAPMVQGTVEPTAFQNNGQTYFVQENGSTMPPGDLTGFLQPTPFTPRYTQQKLVKKSKSKFPANICCCCCCGETEEISALQSNLIGEANRSIILKPIRRERIVEVMKEEIQERVINVPQIQYVDKYVEVPKPVFKYKIKEVKRAVVVEKIKRVPKIVEEEKIIEVPEIRYVEKEVEVPHIVKKEKIVEVPLPIVKERRIPVLRLRKDEKFQEVDNINYDEMEANITSIRNGAEAPNNTPINGNMEEVNYLNDQKQLESITKQIEAVKITGNERSDEEKGKATAGDSIEVLRNQTSRSYDVPHDQHAKEIDKWIKHLKDAKRTAEIHEKELDHFRMQPRAPNHIEISLDKHTLEGEKNVSGPTVTEVLSVRGISNQDSFEVPDNYGERYGLESIIKDGIDDDYEITEVKEVDDMVSIYPNIDALSFKSMPNDGQAKYQNKQEHETQNMEEERHSATNDKNAVEQRESTTHVRITK